TAIFQKLEQDGKRKQLDQIETALIPVLASILTLDFFGLSHASGALVSDKDMPEPARRAFVQFIMNSLELWAATITAYEQGEKPNSSYINASFQTVVLSVRPTIAQYSSPDLLRLDVLLTQVSPFVSETTRSRLNAFHSETFSEPRDRLNDILKD